MTANPPAGSGRDAHLVNAGVPVNGTDEIQILTVTGTPTGGTFTIGFGSFVTGNIDHDAAASAVQTALRAIASIGATGCTVTGSAGGPWTVTFDGDPLQKLNVPLMTLVTNALTGGSSPTVTPTVDTPGVDATHRLAPKAALLLDTTNGAEYINTGVSGAPVWNDVGATSPGEIALTEDQILVGAATNLAAAKAVSGDLTAVATGAFTIVDDILEGSNAAEIADANVISGQLLFHRVLLASGADQDIDVALTHKFRVVDVTVVLKGAGTTGCLVTAKNVTTAITDAINVAAGSDTDKFSAGQIDDAAHEIADGANLRISAVSTGADFPGAEVTVWGYRVV